MYLCFSRKKKTSKFASKMPIKIFSCRLRPQQLLGLFGKLGTSQFSKEAKLFSVSTVKFLTTPFQNNISSNYFQCKTFKRILLTHPFYFLTKWVIDGAPILHFSMQLLSLPIKQCFPILYRFTKHFYANMQKVNISPLTNSFQCMHSVSGRTFQFRLAKKKGLTTYLNLLMLAGSIVLLASFICVQI